MSAALRVFSPAGVPSTSPRCPDLHCYGSYQGGVPTLMLRDKQAPRRHPTVPARCSLLTPCHISRFLLALSSLAALSLSLSFSLSSSLSLSFSLSSSLSLSSLAALSRSHRSSLLSCVVRRYNSSRLLITLICAEVHHWRKVILAKVVSLYHFGEDHTNHR